MKRELDVCKMRISGRRCSRLEAYGNPIESANFLCLGADASRVSLQEFEEKDVPQDCERILKYSRKESSDSLQSMRDKMWTFRLNGIQSFKINGLMLGEDQRVDDFCMILRLLETSRFPVKNIGNFGDALIRGLNSDYFKKQISEIIVKFEDMDRDECNVFFIGCLEGYMHKLGGLLEFLDN